MSEKFSELGLQLQLENVVATEKFNEILDVAIDTCLQDKDKYYSFLEDIEKADDEVPANEQKLVEKLGVWGLKAHIDFSEHASTFVRSEEDDLPAPLMHDVLADPSIVPLRPDIRVQNQIEAFGKAIIREAFNCLGKDAREKAEKFGTTADTKEQLEILEWLYERIARIREQLPEGAEQLVDIREPVLSDVIIETLPAEPISEAEITNEPIVIDFSGDNLSAMGEEAAITVDVETGEEDINLDDNGDFYYHPTRLSPKLIGVYPEIHTRTTCLGVSLLASAFFDAAGVEYIHAGVMHTALDSTKMVQLMSINATFNEADEKGYGLNDLAEENMLDIDDAIYKMRRSDRGHHAATLVKLADGTWGYFDPNYNSLDHFCDYDNGEANKTFDSLQLLDTVNKGASLILRNSEGRFSDWFIWAIDDLHQLKRDDTTEKLDTIMNSRNITGGIKDYLLGVAAELPTFETIFNFMVYCTKANNKEKSADRLFSHVIDKYFYAGMEPAAVAERYQADPAFRSRRIEDLYMLPYIMIMKSASDFASNQTRGVHSPPALLEVGMPAFRIGACVLSDFSVYVGNEVPLSFWVANWQSHIAVEGHLPSKNDGNVQSELGRRMSSIIRSGMLRHFTSYGIIHKFLEQGVEKDGNQQG